MAKLEVYKDSPEEIKRLATSDLPFPKDLILKINQLCVLRTINKTDYIATLELWEGKFLERVFAYKLDRRKRGLDQIVCKEVSRILEGNSNKLIKDLYLAGMGGCHTLWTEKTKRSWYAYYELTLDEMFKTAEQDRFNVGACKYYCELVSDDQLLLLGGNKYWPYNYFNNLNFQYALDLDQSIRYCGYDKKSGGYCYLSDFMEYISWFRVFPQIEMYAKLKLIHLITDSRFYNKLLKDKEFKSFVLINRELIYSKTIMYVDLIRAYKAKKTLERYIFEKEMKSVISNYHITDENILSNFEKIYKYVKSQPEQNSFGYYMDYYNEAKVFVAMDEVKHLMPHDLVYWHDYYISQKEAKKREELVEGFMTAVNQWSYLNYKNKLFMITVAPTQEEVIEEGKELKHCVGRAGYIEEMAKGKNLIMFIRENDNPLQSFYTVEFDKESNQVRQCRGLENHQELRWDEVKAFTDEWINKIPYLKRKNKKEEEVNEQSNFSGSFSEGPRNQIYEQQSSLCAI